MSNQNHAAVLQLIADGIRQPSHQFNSVQLERIATILDKIAVDLLLPAARDGDVSPSQSGELAANRAALLFGNS